MDIDYNKIVSFLLGKSVSSISHVLKEVLTTGYRLMDVDNENKIIYLKSLDTSKDYYMIRRMQNIIIIPEGYSNLSLGEEFGEILEISINDDSDVVLSSIKEIKNPNGVCVTTSTWHNNDDKYTQVVGRVMYITRDNISSLINKESIEMFLINYNSKRTGIFKDLYWDMTSLLKSSFIEIKINERVQVNDGYTKESFEELYKRWNMEVNKIVTKKGSSLF